MSVKLSFLRFCSCLTLQRRRTGSTWKRRFQTPQFAFCSKKHFHKVTICQSSVEHINSPVFENSGSKKSLCHVPVLLESVIEHATQLKTKGKVFVDCTVGAGGHCKAIMDLGIFSKCIAIDKDESCEQLLKERILSHSVRFVHGSFASIEEILVQEKVASEEIGFILADLGVSSMQLENPCRGFSFLKDGPLDMRMDQSLSTTAWKIVNQYSEEELCKIIRELGEERKWRRVAAAIVNERRKNPIDTTCQLAEIVCAAKRERRRHSKIHPATLTFQSLRLYINNELDELNNFIPKALKCLGPFGRLTVISFHSLEDRIVKQSFKEYVEKGDYRILTKKPIVPSEEERDSNVRCRSAKMRVIERIPKTP